VTPGLRKEAADLTIRETLEHRQGFTPAECSIAAYLLAHGNVRQPVSAPGRWQFPARPTIRFSQKTFPLLYFLCRDVRLPNIEIRLFSC